MSGEAGDASDLGAGEASDDRRSAPGPSSEFRPASGESPDAHDEGPDGWRGDSAGATPGTTAAGRGSDGTPWSWPADRGLDVLAGIRAPSGLAGRAAIALLGWPPLGVAFAALVSEASGCGRFAASCVDTFDLGTWAGQLAIIGLLLALPKLASISAIGTLAMLTVSVPVAILLSAAGGARDRDAAASVLMAVLIAAYAVGVVIAVARGARTMRA
jgi:hypothetical protein